MAAIKFFLLLLLGLLTTITALSRPIILGYSEVESFPYQMGNGFDIPRAPGVAVEMIQAAADDLGIEVEFRRTPNRRTLVSLRTGEIDGSLIFSYNDERAEFASYPMRNGQPDAARRIARRTYYLYRMRGDSVDWDGKHLTGLRRPVGANDGYSIVGDLVKLNIPVEEAKSTEQNFAKLKMGRISAVALLEDTADAYVIRSGSTDIEKIPAPFLVKDYFLIFSRHFANQNNEVVERLWNRIGEIRDHKARELMPKYLLKPAERRQ